MDQETQAGLERLGALAVLDQEKPQTETSCAHCGKTFPSKPGKKHCSESCRKTYYQSGNLGFKQRQVIAAIVTGIIDERLKQHGLLPGATNK